MPMTIHRRTMIAAAAGLLATPATARAQEGPWPSRPVTLLVPWGPGGSTDAIARVLAQRLSTDLGQPFVVENRVGANGTIGLGLAARAKPDGYTLVISPNSTYAIAPHIYALGYEVERAFAGVGLVMSMPIFMMVGRQNPARSLADFLAAARRPNHGMTFANPGVGATTHMANELLMKEARIELADIGYRGGGPAIQAVVAGEATMLFMPASAVMGLLANGDLRALGVATLQRTPLAPEVPTIAEQGFPGFEVVEHISLLAPAGTPQPVLEKANAACRAALLAPDMKSRWDAMVVTPEARPQAEWAGYLAAESGKWRDLVRTLNIRVQ
jgi:tripartite-type tricarboxylate transporter receptor subunit TctC